ncbi:MAG: hypothetical protein GX649_19305 [Chloroflexi bacterium]|nr:hypothetical protein [Chloroflexota bacterium]
MDYFGGSLLPPLPETLGSQFGDEGTEPLSPVRKQAPRGAGEPSETPYVPTDPVHRQRWKDAFEEIRGLVEQYDNNTAIAKIMKLMHPKLRANNEKTVAQIRAAGDAGLLRD